MKQTTTSTQPNLNKAQDNGRSVTMSIADWPEYARRHGLEIVSASWNGNGPLMVEVRRINKSESENGGQA